MFTLDQTMTVPKLREKNLVKFFFSMNNHQVATPEMMLEEARSYVMFCGEDNGKVSAYIGLYLLLTDRRLFFAHSSNPFPPGEMGTVEEEALSFVEGLGALVDQIDIAVMPADEKSRWLDSQDMFSLKARLGKSSEAESAQTAEAEAERPEPQASQSPAAAPEVASAAPQIQPITQIELAPQIQPAPQMQPTQQTQLASEAAPQPDAPPQAAPTAPPLPVPPAAEPEPQAPPVEEPAPRSPSPQPVIGPDKEHEGHAVRSSGESPEAGDGPERQQTSAPSAIQEAPVPPSGKAQPKPPARATGSKAAADDASAMGKQDIMRKAIKAGIVKQQKPAIKKEAENDTGVVRRDREALARLLTSF